MRLATPDQVLAILGIQISAGSQATAGVALDATFSILENILDTELLLSTRTDYFDLPSLLRVDPALRLSGSFVSKDDVVEVLTTATGSSLTTEAGVVVASTDYDVNSNQGIVSLIGSYFTGKKVLSVYYTTGFAVSDSDETMLQGFPEALGEAHACLAASFLQQNPANASKDKAKALGPFAANTYDIRARQLLSRYTRPRGTAIWNVSTSVL